MTLSYRAPRGGGGRGGGGEASTGEVEVVAVVKVEALTGSSAKTVAEAVGVAVMVVVVVDGATWSSSCPLPPFLRALRQNRNAISPLKAGLLGGSRKR